LNINSRIPEIEFFQSQKSISSLAVVHSFSKNNSPQKKKSDRIR